VSSSEVAELASVDGRITPTSEAVLPLPDDGLYRGDGVFEVARLFAGKPFAMAEHLDRLERSAAAIHLAVDRAALEAELESILAENGDRDAQLRVIATRGGRRILLIEKLAPVPESIAVATVTYQPTIILNRVKSLSYGANMHATRIAQERGADEALLVTPDGIVLEFPTATIFWGDEDGVLHTPSLANPILDSITRDWVVREVEVAEGCYGIADLQGATEAFLASTTKDVLPIARIDDAELDWPGPLTQSASKALTSAIERELGLSSTGDTR
jgi:branched-chain amino acid aminotransferase